MSTIDNTYFYGELNIGHNTQAAAIASLQMIIDSREDELLRLLMGEALYSAYVTGIAVSEQRMLDIRDGKSYTINGVAKKWVGLKFTVGTAKKSLIANYVYFHYLKDNYSFTTGSSEKKTDLAINVSPDAKLSRAWNEMVKWNRQFHDFMTDNAAAYPEYTQAGYVYPVSYIGFWSWLGRYCTEFNIYALKNSLGI